MAGEKKTGTIVMGMDLALNHAAFVELIDGKLNGYWFVSDNAAASAKKHGTRLPPDFAKEKDPNTRNLKRIVWWEHFIDKKILMPRAPEFVGIEDYALDARQGHMKGELGGIARILCWFRGAKIRFHDPMSIKMFTAHDGTCQKDEIEYAVKKRWGEDFSDRNPPKPPNARRQNRTVSEDIADAYAIAQMVWFEVQLRRGDIRLSDFHEKEIRVFNRVTKTYPVSLLDRDWIVNPEGTPTPHGEPVCATCGSRRCCLAKDGTKDVKKPVGDGRSKKKAASGKRKPQG